MTRHLATALALLAALFFISTASSPSRTITYEDGSWTRSHAGSIIATGCHAGRLCDDSAVVGR